MSGPMTARKDMSDEAKWLLCRRVQHWVWPRDRLGYIVRIPSPLEVLA